MNKEQKKAEINSKRFEFLKNIAKASQDEVTRCFALIDQAQTQEELDAVTFADYGKTVR